MNSMSQKIYMNRVIVGQKLVLTKPNRQRIWDQREYHYHQLIMSIKLLGSITYLSPGLVSIDEFTCAQVLPKSAA